MLKSNSFDVPRHTAMKRLDPKVGLLAASAAALAALLLRRPQLLPGLHGGVDDGGRDVRGVRPGPVQGGDERGDQVQREEDGVSSGPVLHGFFDEHG